MQNTSIDKLNQIVADIFELDASAVSDALTPDDVEHWTSLNHLRLITAVEEAFNISFTMHQIESVRSIGALRELIGS
jgi:acyl carrier protein